MRKPDHEQRQARQPIPSPRTVGHARRHPRTHSRRSGKVRLHSERLPRPVAPTRRVPRFLRLPRCIDGKARQSDQGRARDDRRRHQQPQPVPILRGGARRHPAHPREKSIHRRSSRQQLPEGRSDRPSEGDDRLRYQGFDRSKQGWRRRSRRPQVARLHRRGRMGHCGDHRLLWPVQSPRERHEHAPQR